MEAHLILASINALVEAVAEQCGLMASCHRNCHETGGRTTTVQICLDPNVMPAGRDDWAWIEAKDDADLPRVRDELAQFVAEHRREAA